jgi:hypothetical protein
VREVPATLTVNSTADVVVANNDLTLREAIRVVNGTLALADLSAAERALVDTRSPLGTNDTIQFNIGDGEQSIAPRSALDPIRNSVTIKGAAPADHPTQTITLDGKVLRGLGVANANGLTSMAGRARW